VPKSGLCSRMRRWKPVQHPFLVAIRARSASLSSRKAPASGIHMLLHLRYRSILHMSPQTRTSSHCQIISGQSNIKDYMASRDSRLPHNSNSM
jgi:hypothetical protein